MKIIRFVSNCCGAEPEGYSEEHQRCPECKEHCIFEEIEI